MSSSIRNFIVAAAVVCLAHVTLPAAYAQKAKQAESKSSKAKTSGKTSKSSSADKKTAKKTKPKKTAKKKKPTSPCQGLAKTACERKKDLCGWIKPKKKVDTRGRKLTAYCRKTGGGAKAKKADPKKSTKKAAKSTTKKK